MRSLDLRKVDGVARASCQRVTDDECSESTISAIQRESYLSTFTGIPRGQ